MTDAHCHPFDLREYLPNPQYSANGLGISLAISSSNLEQFEYNDKFSKDSGVKCFKCFGIHPQLLSDTELFKTQKINLLSLLENLPQKKSLEAIGETGFDLYDEKNRETEKIQEELFILHTETAIKYNLPLVIHIRRAIHKIFKFTKELKKIPSVIFHSWPGTFDEGTVLIRRGINAYFSFGASLVNNHKKAIQSARLLPLEKILLETDAPYQPLKNKSFSSWEDLKIICSRFSSLRQENIKNNSAEYLESIVDSNFFTAFTRSVI